MYLDFEKWHGCRNDFIVVWATTAELDMLSGSLSRLAPKLCSRFGDGIAGDGILILETASRKEASPRSLTIINSDGSFAKNCGNGLRCAAASVKRRAAQDFSEFLDAVELRVGENLFICQFIVGSSKASNKISFVSVDMPSPVIGEANSWHKEFCDAAKSLLDKAQQKFDLFETVSISNPHGIVMLGQQASDDQIFDWGDQLQSLRSGDGLNVHFVAPLELTDKVITTAKNQTGFSVGDIYSVVPFERGAGLTQACGSGACAVAASAFQQGSVSRDEVVAIDMPGGRLYVKQEEEAGPITLIGPAEYVFSGRIEI
jgi:diaminopimelate epimerase